MIRIVTTAQTANKPNKGGFPHQNKLLTNDDLCMFLVCIVFLWPQTVQIRLVVLVETAQTFIFCLCTQAALVPRAHFTECELCPRFKKKNFAWISRPVFCFFLTN